MRGMPEWWTARGRTCDPCRVKAGLSQETLALEAGLQRNYISLMKLGRNQPTITTLFRLSAALEISPSEILKEVERRVISGLAD